ncbi:ABC transporter permease [Celeribacter sp.]|uniref:ABC transporter permease n=1 Tax=Celeribacter sp. TaxID=1890673 RepID=UPI003A8D3DC8
MTTVTRIKPSAAWLWAGALIGLAVLSLFVGVTSISLRDVFADAGATKLFVVSRLPRTLAVLITGAALAVSGTVMQMLVRNRFVEPMTAGTGQGAALGILLSVTVFPAAPLMAKMVIASVTALAASVIFLMIVRRLPPQQPLLVPLVGMVYGGILGAMVVFFAYQTDLLQYVSVWMNGEFSGVLKGRYELLWLAAITAIFCYIVADHFSIIGMGHEISINLGLNYKQVMLMGLIAISIVSALTVVTVGMIPFVGLVVPNIISRRMGDNLRATLPATAMMGAGMVLASDILGRLLRYPFEIPVGSVFGVIGAVIFLWLLYAPARHAR